MFLGAVLEVSGPSVQYVSEGESAGRHPTHGLI